MSVPTDHGPISQDIYRHFEAEIYPTNPKKETKFQWRDILGGIFPKRSQLETFRNISALILSSITTLSNGPLRSR
jgi:hypothetical protein